MSHPPFAVTVDLVLLSMSGPQLAIVLQRRSEEPFAECLALPGGFVGLAETLDQAARRVLTDKAGLEDGAGWLEQLYSFGDPARDPRMRTVSVAYYALLPQPLVDCAIAARSDLALVPPDADGEALAFDHRTIIQAAHDRIRGKLDYAPIALALLPDLFTLRDLQKVHEAITGISVNKPAFRRRMIDTGWIEATGQRETDTTFRPAELYRRSVAIAG